MATVVLERLFDPPLGVADVAAMEREAGGCMAQHRVDHVFSLLSPDGRDLICTFAAPDAEAVRRVLQQLGDAPAQRARAWSASVHAPPAFPPQAPLADGSDAAVVLVERSFADPIAFAPLQAKEDAGAWCLDQHGVRHLRSYFSLDRRRMLCLYAAPDAEAVRHVQRQIDLPHDRVWRAQVWESRR